MTAPTDIQPPAIDQPVDDGDTLDQPEPHDDNTDADGQVDGDPLAIAQMLLSSAADRILQHKQGGTFSDKVALGHALATFALASAIRRQTAIMANAQALEVARMQAKQAAGMTGSGLVVAR
jgi:hypothetical protein